MLEPVCPIPNPSQAGYIQSRIASGLVGLKRDLDGVAGVLGQPDCYRKTNRAKKKKIKIKIKIKRHSHDKGKDDKGNSGLVHIQSNLSRASAVG